MTRRARWTIWIGLMGMLALSGCRILRDEFFFTKPTPPSPSNEVPDGTELRAERDV